MLDYIVGRNSSYSTLAVEWMRCSPSRLTVMQLSTDGFLRIFYLDDPDAPPSEVEVHRTVSARHVHGSIAVSLDSLLIATAAGPELKVWDVLTGSVSLFFERDSISTPTLPGQLKLKLSYGNSSRDASHITHLSFISGGQHLLAFFMNERVMYAPSSKLLSSY